MKMINTLSDNQESRIKKLEESNKSITKEFIGLKNEVDRLKSEKSEKNELMNQVFNKVLRLEKAFIKIMKMSGIVEGEEAELIVNSLHETNMDIVKEEKVEVKKKKKRYKNPKKFTALSKKELKKLKNSTKYQKELKRNLKIENILFVGEVGQRTASSFLKIEDENATIGDLFDKLNEYIDEEKYQAFLDIVETKQGKKQAFYHLRSLMKAEGWNVKVIYNED